MSEAGPSGVAEATEFPNPAERIAKAEEYKSMGNDLYKIKNFKAAIGKYHRALLQLKDLDMATKHRDMRAAVGLPGGRTGHRTIPQEVKSRAADIEADCFNNLAACLLQQPSPNYSKVDHYCRQVLKRKSRSDKALYRRGMALYHLHDYEDAHRSLSAAQELSPEDANVKRYLHMCETAMAKQAQAERTRYKGMFDKMAAHGDH